MDTHRTRKFPGRRVNSRRIPSPKENAPPLIFEGSFRKAAPYPFLTARLSAAQNPGAPRGSALQTQSSTLQTQRASTAVTLSGPPFSFALLMSWAAAVVMSGAD